MSYYRVKGMERVTLPGNDQYERRNKIAPSVLSADFMRLGEQLSEAERAGADYVHYDVMDGHFVPEISYGEGILRQIQKATDMTLDVHLMITNPEDQIPLFAAAGADIITFHLEAAKKGGEPNSVKELISEIHDCGIQAGISIKPGTPVEDVFPYLSEVEMVLLMTVEPGFGGQPYLSESDERIAALRAEIDRLGLPCDIEVDGGIDFETVKRAASAGANVFVSGSTVFRGDITGNIAKLKSALLAEK